MNALPFCRAQAFSLGHALSGQPNFTSLTVKFYEFCSELQEFALNLFCQINGITNIDIEEDKPHSDDESSEISGRDNRPILAIMEALRKALK
jgi:hypothetical protein